MAKGSAAAAAAMVTLAVVVMPRQVSGHRYIVGSSTNGWTTNVDYNIWARRNHFYVGDWLFFVYDSNKMNVLEVNKTDYEKCNSDHPLHNWTTGSEVDVVPLNLTMDYYFISGNGFCNKGMKLAVHVENPPSHSPPKSPSPSPIPHGSGNVSNTTSFSTPELSPPLGSPAPHPGEAGDPPKDRGHVAQKSDSSTLLPGGMFIASIIAVGAVWDLFLVQW